MLCEECGQKMQQVHDMEHFRCADCNQFHFPEDSESCSDMIVPAGKISPMFCPHCPRAQLAFGELLGQRICFCFNCRGYLIDRRSLGHLSGTLREAYNGPEDEPVMLCQDELQGRSRCPSCRHPMDTGPYYGPGNIVIDSCMRCEVTWLNYGELLKIVRAPGSREHSGMTPRDDGSVLDKLFYVQTNLSG